MSRHHFPAGRCALRAFTQATEASCEVGASTVLASVAYSREIDMQARWKTRRTASAGVGIVGFVIRRLVDVPGANRAVRAADSPVKGGAARRAHRQA